MAPKFWKFHITTSDKEPVEVAYTDARRFGRVRLVDCPGDSIRKYSPLVENGPDPVVDKDIFTEEYLRGKIQSRHVPIKALLLDQTVISGIGNWVADETLYQSKIHPEQYSDSFSDKEIARLHEAIRYVCQLAVDKLGDSNEFPEHWLFNHRWGKGDKNSAARLPNGEKLAFITVGGRTSCYAPGVQKKTGAVAAGAKTEPIKSESVKAKPTKSKSVKSEPKEEEDEDDDKETVEETKPKRSRKKAAEVKEEPEESDGESPPAKKRRGKAAAEKSKPTTVKKEIKEEAIEETSGRRRSGRLRK